MKKSTLKYSTLQWTASLIMIIIMVMPFHAFLTVWLSSLVGHYTALRLWKELLLIVAGSGAIFLLLTDQKIRQNTLSRRIVWLILAYIALNIVWGIIGFFGGDLSAKALGYGLIVNTRFLIFFLIAWAVALRTDRLRNNWQKMVLWPAVIVVVFGILQFSVLPNDFLKHFGYSVSTIEPFETINSNSNYIRISSTLRGANPLGAYLIIPITFLAMLIMRGKRTWQNVTLLIGALMALVFTFSRSAWIGTALALSTLGVMNLEGRNIAKSNLLLLSLLLALIAGSAYALRSNSHFQNVIFHTEDRSVVKVSSNQNHWSATKNGVIDVAKHPLGFGPGSAGPASSYNNGNGRIAENYFVQVGQELGWIGLVFFTVINIGVGYLLWLKRADPLALGLFASFIGITAVNMLMHAWADDTLAYVWWGLAGIAMAPIHVKVKKKRS
ncbi:MAG: O-antigen ligase family protein [bacterium]